MNCDPNTKPTESEPCGNCGTRTRSASCDTSTGKWNVGEWGKCTGEGVCTPGAPVTDKEGCEFGSVVKQCLNTCQWKILSDTCCNSSRTFVKTIELEYPNTSIISNGCGGSRFYSQNERYTCTEADKGKSCNEYVLRSERVEVESSPAVTITGRWRSSSRCSLSVPHSTCGSVPYRTNVNGAFAELPDATELCKTRCHINGCGGDSCTLYNGKPVDHCPPYEKAGTQQPYQLYSVTLNCQAEETEPTASTAMKTLYYADVYEVNCCK